MEMDSKRGMHYQINYSALPFVESVKEQVEKKFWLSPKQKQGLTKVYKRYIKRKENVNKIKK